jgi:hypothetical protein
MNGEEDCSGFPSAIASSLDRLGPIEVAKSSLTNKSSKWAMALMQGPYLGCSFLTRNTPSPLTSFCTFRRLAMHRPPLRPIILLSVFQMIRLL